MFIDLEMEEGDSWVDAGWSLVELEEL